jgi:hypothetical protein
MKLWNIMLLVSVAIFSGCKKEESKYSSTVDPFESKLLSHEVVAIESVHSSLFESLERKEESISREYSSLLARVILSNVDERLSTHLYFPYYKNSFVRLFDTNDPLGWKKYYNNNDYVIVTEMDGIVGVADIRAGPLGAKGMRVVDSIVCEDKYRAYFSNGDEYDKLGVYLLQKFEQGVSEFRREISINESTTTRQVK